MRENIWRFQKYLSATVMVTSANPAFAAGGFNSVRVAGMSISLSSVMSIDWRSE